MLHTCISLCAFLHVFIQLLCLVFQPENTKKRTIGIHARRIQTLNRFTHIKLVLNSYGNNSLKEEESVCPKLSRMLGV